MARARSAWARWLAGRKFDDVSWHEIRLLSALSTRMAELDPHSPFRPRIEGLARSHWTRTQLALRESAEAIEILDHAGIRYLLIKGAAQYAGGLAGKIRRILADIDILVPPEQAARAIDELVSAGWSGANGESAGYLRAVGDIRFSINLLKGRYGEVDLHRTAFHYRRADRTADDLLWASAEAGSLNGQPVTVPSPAVNVLITLAHATASQGGDWALDVAKRIKHQTIDWDTLAELAARLRLNLPVRAGLLYLQEQLEIPVPAEVVQRLANAPSDWADKLKLWSNVRERDERSLGEKIVNRMTNRVLARRGYELPVSDRTRLAVIRPQALAALAFFRTSRTITLRPEATDWSTHAILALSSGNAASKLVIELEFHVPRRSRRIYFDLSRGRKAFARIKTRAGGSMAGAMKRIAAVVSVPPGGNAEISIEACPTQFVRPVAPGLPSDVTDALSFRLVRAATI